jgi:glucose-6-phosphate 1-dehydrogenase
MTDTTSIIIFGASGDLTSRKLVPALFNLHRKGRLPEGFHLLGMARSDSETAAFRAELRDAAAPSDAAAWSAFESQLDYLRGDPTDADSLSRLESKVSATERAGGGTANRLYYLATPPHVYADVVLRLGAAGMVDRRRGWRRVIIEKPFGSDLASAQELNRLLHQVLDEDQIYRIDHYLGKETVQNVLVFRFANSIFEPLWNRNYIDHVQITVAETVGVEHRGPFYDRVGVVRDMFQNHLIQVLGMAAMEPPASFDAESLRNERIKLLRAVRPFQPQDVARDTLRAQYDGYRREPGVAPDSRTPTFAVLKLLIDNWRWQGVPFYLRSGKSLAAKATSIVIQFKSVPHVMFPLPPGQGIRPNSLAICLQPDEGMHLQFEVKEPDTLAAMRPVDMEFHYADDFGPGAIPDAYERLLLDAFHGDPSLYTRGDSIELAWALVDPILQGWERPDAPPLLGYAPGTWGPPECGARMAAEGRAWSADCARHDT